MYTLLKMIDNFIWGLPLLLLLVGTGCYLSCRLKLIQIIRLKLAFTMIFKKSNDTGDITSFAALATALAATVGTGNIVGVATAIKSGGPGALFWMWVAAFFGMATKYSEGFLAIKYRIKDSNHQISGGPMYYITNGMGKQWKPLAFMFAISGLLVALFGIGTFTQVNAITSALHHSFGMSSKLISIILALFVAIIIFGGIQSISTLSGKIVPLMAIFYIGSSLIIIIVNIKLLLPSLILILKSAFTPTAAIGGFSGSLVKDAIQKGIARGIFSNESGLGSAPIAAAAAKTNEPVEQGLVSMIGTFIDTLIICSLTGLSIIITGQWQSSLEGAPLTQSAFVSVFGQIGGLIISLSLVLFAFTTILGWSYYGEKCFTFLFRVEWINYYRLIFICMIALGGFLNLNVIWYLADIVNGLMALPNLIAINFLAPIIIKETIHYFKTLKSKT